MRSLSGADTTISYGRLSLLPPLLAVVVVVDESSCNVFSFARFLQCTTLKVEMSVKFTKKDQMFICVNLLKKRLI